jgi:hypothetical protein
MHDMPVTVINDDVAANVSAQSDAGELWISIADLSRAARLELKPQGVCRGEICYPLPPSKQSEFLREEAGKSWFNLTAFARLTGQAVAHDAARSTWYFGVRPDQRQQLSSLEAPDFTLPDIDGKLHSLSDFRGNKVFLVTWASW